MQKEFGEEIPPDVRRDDSYPNKEFSPSEGEKVGFDFAGYLEGLTFPAEKQDVIDYLEDQDAGPEILSLVEQIPDTTYNSPSDVSQAIAENS